MNWATKTVKVCFLLHFRCSYLKYFNIKGVSYLVGQVKCFLTNFPRRFYHLYHDCYLKSIKKRQTKNQLMDIIMNSWRELQETHGICDVTWTDIESSVFAERCKNQKKINCMCTRNCRVKHTVTVEPLHSWMTLQIKHMFKKVLS